jgi:osmotically inducible protein OsmC
MLAAAHASCISLMFAQELARAGFKTKTVRTNARMKVEEVDSQWTITAIHLDVSVEASEMSPEHFQHVAELARANCPITRALKTKITMDAKFTPAAVHAVV